MEKSDKKAEYISIPTEEHQEGPFAYEVRQKSAFNYRALAAKGALIAAAILAVGALHKSFTPGNSIVQKYDESFYNPPEPCVLKHNKDYKELKTFVEELQESMGFGGDRYSHSRGDYKFHDKPHHPPFPGGPNHFGEHPSPPPGCYPPPPPPSPPHDGPEHPPFPPPPHDGPEHPPRHPSDCHPPPPPPPGCYPPPPPHDGPEHPPPKDGEKPPKDGGEPPKDDDKSEDDELQDSEQTDDGNMPLNSVKSDDSHPPYPGFEHHSPHMRIPNDANDFDFDHDKEDHEPFCKVSELEAQSTVFTISPETFQKTKFFLNGHFNRGGHVRISKSNDASAKDIKVNVTTYANQSDVRSEAIISAFENEGNYIVQLERDYKHPPPPAACHGPLPPPPKPDQQHCLVYSVDIEFPQDTESYEVLEFFVQQTQRLEGGKDIEDINFGSIKAGLGRGAIVFDFFFNLFFY
ncbi:hypothetical protein G6F29_004558 [Rhizopus arrhizus]|nr:hypothetical protein G6F29_004558 [Rhizopus arrhizus]